jgi:uncharacterized repeat protein (TIGR01451 family)
VNDANGGNNVDTEETTVTGAAPGEADLSVTKTDSPDPVTAGDPLTYNLTVTNTGPDAAEEVSLSDQMDPQTTFQSITPSSASWSCTPPPAGTAVVFCSRSGPMAPGASETFFLLVRVNATATGTIINKVEVGSGATLDPNPGNNADTENTEVTRPPPPPPPPQSGKVTGGGQVPVTGGTASFGFDAKVENGAASGHLSYTNHATGAQLDCTVTELTFGPTPNSAKFSGRDCKAPKSAGGSFEAEVEDNGEPGKKNMDKFTITYIGTREGGTLRSGNIQIRKEPPPPPGPLPIP